MLQLVFCLILEWYFQVWLYLISSMPSGWWVPYCFPSKKKVASPKCLPVASSGHVPSGKYVNQKCVSSHMPLPMPVQKEGLAWMFLARIASKKLVVHLFVQQSAVQGANST